MFQILLRMMLDDEGPAAAGSITDVHNATQDGTIIDAPAPRPDQLPMGSSRNTWPNIVNNKVRCGALSCAFHGCMHACVLQVWA